MISDKQVLLDKIEIKEGTTTKLNTNLYVSYRSGNAQKFWANLAIATAGVAVSTQLQSHSSAEGNNVTGISPLIPLGVSVATLPSIWKNCPRGVPQAGLWLQHRDTRGRLTDTWEQPISSEAKNSGELLSINIDKPLSAGTVEVYLQNGSKNPVYYWGYETSKNTIENKLLPPKTPTIANSVGCPSGYLPNGNGMCCNPFTGECVNEGSGDNDGGSGNGGGGGNPTPQGCPSGYLPNGQGMCCQPGTNNCVPEGSSGSGGGGNGSTLPFIGCPDGFLPNGQGLCCKPGTNQCVEEATNANGKNWKKEVRTRVIGPAPVNNSTNSTQSCDIVETCIDWYSCVSIPSRPELGTSCSYNYTECTQSSSCGGGDTDGGGGTGGGGGGGTGGGGGGSTGGECINGYRNGIPCGEPICGNNGYNQYNQKCGRNCNTATGYDQFGDPCGPSICEIGILHPESIDPNNHSSARMATVTIDQYGHECIIPLTPGFRTKSFDCDVLKHLWANSFRNGAVYKENAVVFTTNGSYLQPLSGTSCGGGVASNTTNASKLDYLGCFTRENGVTYYTPTDSFDKYEVIVVVHSHPNTINGNPFQPSPADRATYNILQVPSYIIGNTGIIQYTNEEKNVYTPIKSMEDLQYCLFKIR